MSETSGGGRTDAAATQCRLRRRMRCPSPSRRRHPGPRGASGLGARVEFAEQPPLLGGHPRRRSDRSPELSSGFMFCFVERRRGEQEVQRTAIPSCRPDHTLRGSPAKGPTHSPPPPRDGRPKSARVLSTCRLSARLPLSCDAHLAAGTDGSSTSFSASATGGDQSWARIAGGRACPEPGRQGAPHVAPGASTSTDAPGKAPRAAALSGSQSEGLDVAPPNTTNCGDCRLRFSARRCATRRRRRQKSAIIAAKQAKARNAPRSMSALHPQRGVNSNLPVSSGAAFENAYQLLRGRISTVTRTHINSSLDRRAHRIETSHCRRRCFPWHLRHHPLPSGGAAFASRRFS